MKKFKKCVHHFGLNALYTQDKITLNPNRLLGIKLPSQVGTYRTAPLKTATSSFWRGFSAPVT